MKKLFCAMLSVLFIISLVGCKSTGDEVENSSTVQENENVSVETDNTDTPSTPSSDVADTSSTTSFESVTSGIDVPTYTPVTPSSPIINIELLKPVWETDIQTYEPVKPNKIEMEFEDFKNAIQDNIDAEDAEKLAGLTQEEINAIATKKAEFQYDLIIALKNTGINAGFNDKNGEICLDSSVLFGGDSAELSDAGKTFLTDFIKAYTSVVLKEKYNGFISKVMIEGHTAPVAGSTYESGLPLSQQRASEVKTYCLSEKAGLTGTQLETMKNMLVAKGLSNSEPIKDSSGKVDLAASRRVNFSFIINID